MEKKRTGTAAEVEQESSDPELQGRCCTSGCVPGSTHLDHMSESPPPVLVDKAKERTVVMEADPEQRTEPKAPRLQAEDTSWKWSHRSGKCYFHVQNNNNKSLVQ